MFLWLFGRYSWLYNGQEGALLGEGISLPTRHVHKPQDLRFIL